MTITFIGHMMYDNFIEYEARAFSILEAEIGDEPAEICLGGLDGFDSFAFAVSKRYRKTHPRTRIVLITLAAKSDPFYNNWFDTVLCPELREYNVSCQYRYLVEKSDLIISNIVHNFGEEFELYKHAKEKDKRIINLSAS